MTTTDEGDAAPRSRSARAGKAAAVTLRTIVSLFLIAAVVAAGLLVGGFVRFSSVVTAADSNENGPKAEAIVVLTGGATRIRSGLQLLSEGRGDRLLISGVNPTTSSAAISKINAEHASQFKCCVDLEREARDTIGNATETAKWVRRHDYDSLIVVTSNYHMPRSLLEFRRAMPETRLIAHPVRLAELERDDWWRDSATLRLMITEYAKYVGAGARRYLRSETVTALRAWAGGV